MLAVALPSAQCLRIVDASRNPGLGASYAASAALVAAVPDCRHLGELYVEGCDIDDDMEGEDLRRLARPFDSAARPALTVSCW